MVTYDAHLRRTQEPTPEDGKYSDQFIHGIYTWALNPAYEMEVCASEMDDSEQLPAEFRLARSRIMYIEDKSGEIDGEARIGRVFFSKTGKTLYYRGRKFQSLKGSGFKANFFDVESRNEFWISGPRKDRNDRLYGGNRGVEIDEDVREEYEAYLRDV